MDQQLKQRLIGVTVIAALVVIFVPMLFDKAGDRTAGAPEGIPPIPEEVAETRPIELPKSAEDMEEKDKDAIPESGYKIIPLTDEPQPSAKRKGAGQPSESAGQEAPMEEEEGPGGESPASTEALEEGEAEAPPSAVKLEKLDKEAVKSGKKSKPATTPAPAKLDAAKGKALPTKPADAPTKLATKPAKAEPVAKPAGEKSAVSSAWVVQTGSFAVESKATALLEKLRQSKYPAYMEKVQGSSGTLFRVKVGPELDRGRAEQIQKQIEASTGLKGIIVPHR